MKKVIKLTENDLTHIVKRVMNEQILRKKTILNRRRTINEAYLPIIQQGDDICDIVCERKQAKFGSNGDVVKLIQHGLSKCGFNVKREGGGILKGCKDDPKNCDGLFRGETKKAVEEFQAANKLTADGSVGKSTIMKLYDNKCITFKDCGCQTQDTEDQSTIPEKESFLDGVDCDELIDCLKKLMVGDNGKKLDSIPVFNLELCLSKKTPLPKKNLLPKKEGSRCVWQGKTCPSTLNCMPSTGGVNPCQTFMGKYCISTGCTKALQ
jgi:hypothetical protein